MKAERLQTINGILCRDIDGTPFLRCTLPDGSIRDYSIRHSDLCIVVKDDDAYAYYRDGKWIIDHSPATLGITDGSALDT
jgi:hypothetical protein